MKKIFQVSIWKTLYINIRYFGIRGIIHPYIIISRNIKISAVKGSVSIPLKSGVGLIRIGFNKVGICDKRYERGIWHNEGIIEFKGKADFGSGVRISNKGKLYFGENVIINDNTSIVCNEEIEIRKNSLISWDVLIMDTDFHNVYDIHEPNIQINLPSKIVVGEHCWIGCRCLILKGTNLSSNIVVAASSTLAGKKFYQKNTIISEKGILKENIKWKK